MEERVYKRHMKDEKKNCTEPHGTYSNTMVVVEVVIAANQRSENKPSSRAMRRPLKRRRIKSLESRKNYNPPFSQRLMFWFLAMKS